MVARARVMSIAPRARGASGEALLLLVLQMLLVLKMLLVMQMLFRALPK
jgi:hypothetical protein